MRWRCVECPRECAFLEADEFFYRRKRGTFESRCKECTKQRGMRWAAENREGKAATDRRIREARATDPERAAIHADQQQRWREHRPSRRADAAPGERVRLGDRRARRKDTAPRGYVPAGPVREAVERSGLGLTMVARAGGFNNEASVRHALGGERMQARTMAKILGAIGVAPVEVGL